MGMVMPLTAFLITRFPTKKLYMTGIGCFIIGILLSIIGRNFALMMVGRVLQACGKRRAALSGTSRDPDRIIRARTAAP